MKLPMIGNETTGEQRSFLNGSSDVDSEWEGRRQAKQEQAVPCVSVEPVQTAEE